MFLELSSLVFSLMSKDLWLVDLDVFLEVIKDFVVEIGADLSVF